MNLEHVAARLFFCGYIAPEKFTSGRQNNDHRHRNLEGVVVSSSNSKIGLLSEAPDAKQTHSARIY